MSGKQGKKYRLTRETVWAARKSGSFTAYGKTPKAAHDAAIGRAKEAAHARLLRDNLRIRVHQLENRCADLTKKLALLSHKGLTTEEDTADGFVLMAMAFFRLTDPFLALKEAADRNLKIDRCEMDAAKRVQGYMQTWIKKIGNQPEATP